MLTPDLDRFQPPNDPPPVAVCEQCRDDIYPGETIHRTREGVVLCGSHQCVIDHYQVEEMNVDDLEVV
jgi:hypothetical protein